MADSHPARTPRLVGLDVARSLAIIGMIIVNVGTVAATGAEAGLVRLIHGDAAILFIVLAGVGITLLARSLANRSTPLSPTLLWRAGLLMLLGLGLQLLPTGVNVILPLYAALFLTALLAVRLPDRGLVAGALLTGLIGPLVYIALRTGTDLPTDPAVLGQNPLDGAASVLLSGPYPLIVWFAPFVFGMWLGRQDLREPRVHWRMVISGAIATAAAILLSRVLRRWFGQPDPDQLGFDHLLLTAGHSEMPLWLISATGTSALIIGGTLLLTPGLGRAAYPLRATGQLALTTYCLHLIAIAVLVRPESADPNRGLLVSVPIIVGVVVISAVWRLVAARGPLETLLRLPFRTRLHTRRAPPSRRRR